MKTKFSVRHGVLTVVALALLSCLPACRPAQETAAPGAASLRPVPALTLKDLDGREVKLAELKGKVVVIDFWATWCPPCRAEIPGYIELQKKYGPDGLVIVGVSIDTIPPADVKKFAEKNAMNYTLVMGDDSTVEAFGGFEGIPTTYLVDRTGNIVHMKTGAWDHAKYEALVKQAL